MGTWRAVGLALSTVVLLVAQRPGTAIAIDLPNPQDPSPSPTDASSPSPSPTPSAPDTPTGSGAGPVDAPHSEPRLDPRCRTGRVVCVDKSTRQLWLVADGAVRLNMTVRVGGGHPTREGVFKVYRKDRKHVSSLYPGLQMPYSLFFSRGEAVHYSPEFARDGYGKQPASHGCVETRDRGRTAQLFDLVKTGDKVVVYRSGGHRAKHHAHRVDPDVAPPIDRPDQDSSADDPPDAQPRDWP